MIISIMGAQGSGKTTQAELLATKLNLPLLDMGSLIRKACITPTELNKKACDAMQSGHLVPDTFAADLLQDRITHSDCNNGFILDGYPRTLEQLEVFDPKIEKVFFVEVSDVVAIARLLSRNRIDDTPDAIKTRLQTYHARTSKVLEFYDQKGILHKVDGDKSIDAVFKQISAFFNL